MATILGLVVLIRAICAWNPSSCSWALSIERYVPWSMAVLMSLTALTLLLLGVSHAPSEVADWVVRVIAHPAVPLLVVLCVFAWLPDRTHFLGDSMLRQSGFDRATYLRVFPQAARLDVWLFTGLRAWAGFSAATFGRVLGVLGLLGVWLAGVRLSHRLPADRSVRAVAMWVLVFSGYLVFCTGYAKVTPILCGIVALGVAFAVDALDSPKALIPMLLCASVAALLHRSGLILAPLAAVLLIREGTRVLREPVLLISITIFVATLVVAVPPAWQVFRSFDAAHNFGSMPGLSVLNPDHLLSFTEVMIVLAPSLSLLPLLMLPPTGRPWPRRILVLPGATAATALAALIFIVPPQGIVRDWDVLALAGLLVSIVLAMALGLLMALIRPGSWMTLALVATVVFPSFQWLYNSHDRKLGLSRVEALAHTSRSTAQTHAGILDYLGSEYLRDARWADAARTLRAEVALAPHRRVFLAWALAETANGDYEVAADAYQTLLDRRGPDPVAFLCLAGARAALGDTLEARRAVERLRAMPAADVAQCFQYVKSYPQVWPTGDRELLRYALEPALGSE